MACASGDTGLTLAGYGAVDLLHEEGGATTFRVENADLFVIWDPLARVHLFSEIDMVDQENPHEQRRTILTIGCSATSRASTGSTCGRQVPHPDRALESDPRPATGVDDVPPARDHAALRPYVTGAMLFGSRFPRAPARSRTRCTASSRTTSTSSHPPSPWTGASAAAWSMRASGVVRRRLVPAFTALPGEREPGGTAAGTSGLAPPGRPRHALASRPVRAVGRVRVPGAGARFRTPVGFYLQPVTRCCPGSTRSRATSTTSGLRRTRRSTSACSARLQALPFVVLKGEYLFADHRAEQSPPGVKTSFTVLF